MTEFLMKSKIDFAFKEIMMDEKARVRFLSARSKGISIYCVRFSSRCYVPVEQAKHGPKWNVDATATPSKICLVK